MPGPARGLSLAIMDDDDVGDVRYDCEVAGVPVLVTEHARAGAVSG